MYNIWMFYVFSQFMDMNNKIVRPGKIDTFHEARKEAMRWAIYAPGKELDTLL